MKVDGSCDGVLRAIGAGRVSPVLQGPRSRPDRSPSRVPHFRKHNACLRPDGFLRKLSYFSLRSRRIRLTSPACPMPRNTTSTMGEAAHASYNNAIEELRVKEYPMLQGKSVEYPRGPMLTYQTRRTWTMPAPRSTPNR